jgi:ABC-type branched-subunit amino acid transport system ATPase component
MSASVSASPLLDAKGITVTFGGVKALSDVSCRVEASEIVGIIGPNGAGKTTLLNVLSRFTRAREGARISLGGVDLLRRRPRELARLGLARTFQTPEMSPSSSIWANVLMGAHSRLAATRNTRADRRDIDEEARHFLGVLGIERWARAAMEELPFATRKRAEICRALLADPTLLLLDEPASGMSSLEKSELARALRVVHDETGTAILVIEHDVGFLAGLCDRLMALNFGMKIADGSPDEVVSDETVIDAYLGREDA